MQRFFLLKQCDLTFESCCEAEGKLWFFANEFNALCNMDLSGYKVDYISSMPDEDIFTRYLCAGIKYFQGKLFLTPRAASYIAVYDIKTEEFETIKLEKPIRYEANPYINWLKFISSIIVGDSLYMIPRSYPAIVEFNLHTYKQTYHVQWLYDIKDKIMDQDSFFWSDCIVRDKELILASSIADMIFSFNTETKSYAVLHSGEIQQSYSGMTMIGKDILLSERKSGKLKQWNLSQNIITDYGKMPDGFVTKQIIGFSSLIQMENSIFAIPLWANMMLRIVPENTEIQTIKNYDEERGTSEEIAVGCAWTINQKLYCMNNLSKCIDVFDENGNMEDSFYMKMSNDFSTQMEEKILSSKKPLFGESRIFPIGTYVKYVPLSLNQRYSNKTGLEENDSIGQKILKILN